VPLSLSLSLSVHVLVKRSYAGALQPPNAYLIFRQRRPSYTTFGIRAWFFNPLSAVVSTCTAFGFLRHSKKRRKKAKRKLESRCVRSSLGVSQSAVLYSLDRNCLRWASCTSTTSRTTPVRVSFDWKIIGRTSRFHRVHRCRQPKPNRLEVLSYR
jgi:hypothetical protein